MNYINEYREEYGVAPSVREITDDLGLSSTSLTHWHLRKLQEAGLVTWQPRKARTLRVTNFPQTAESREAS